MKRGLFILIAALLAGLAGFAVSRWHSADPISESPAAGHDSSLLPELEWLRHEFDLTDEQFAKVSELHFAYRPTCESLCEKIMVSREKVKRLVTGGTRVSPELAEALREHASLHADCQTAMLAHLYETAACLSPEQAKRYLEAMVPQVMEMTTDHEPASRRH